MFENNRWTIVPKSEYGKLPKAEAQVWIALFNLFMDPECRKKYELNDERKNTLLRVCFLTYALAKKVHERSFTRPDPQPLRYAQILIRTFFNERPHPPLL